MDIYIHCIDGWMQHCELFDEKSTTRNEEMENNNDNDDNNDYDNIKKLTHIKASAQNLQ